MINKKYSKSFIILASVTILGTTFFPTSTILASEAQSDLQIVTAKENESDIYVKNDLYIQFEKEMAELLATKKINFLHMV